MWTSESEYERPLRNCYTVVRTTKRQVPFRSGSRCKILLIFGRPILLDGPPIHYYHKQCPLMDFFGRRCFLTVHTSSMNEVRLRFKLISNIQRTLKFFSLPPFSKDAGLLHFHCSYRKFLSMSRTHNKKVCRRQS